MLEVAEAAREHLVGRLAGHIIRHEGPVILGLEPNMSERLDARVPDVGGLLGRDPQLLLISAPDLPGDGCVT